MTSGRIACAVSPGAPPLWSFVVGRGFLAAVPLGTTQAVLASLNARVRDPSVEVEELLALLPIAGPGEVRSFAVLVRGDGDGESADGITVSVVVRGDIAVDVFSVGGSRRFAANGIRPWLLADFRAVVGIVVGGVAVGGGPARDDQRAATGGRWQDGGAPIGIGVVPADTLYWSWPEPGIDDTVLGVVRRAEADGDTVLRVPTTDAEDTVILRRRPRNGQQGGIGVTAARAKPAPAPPLPRYRFRIDGDERSLDSVYLLGRAPRSPRITDGRLPRLLAVASPTNAVSSTHLEIRQEGDAVVVTDLDSTNGTLVTLPSGRTTRMAPGNSFVVVSGTTIDIGDGNIIEILPASVRQPQ